MSEQNEGTQPSASVSRPESGRWCIVAARSILVVLAIALVTLTGIPMVMSFASEGAPRIGTNAFVSAAGPGNIALAGTCGVSSLRGAAATLLVQARRYDATNSTLATALSLCVTNRWLKSIRFHGRPVVHNDFASRTGLAARPGLADKKVGIEVDIYPGNTLNRNTGPEAQGIRAYGEYLDLYTTIGRLANSAIPRAGDDRPLSTGPVLIATLRLPVTARPGDYPFDWYAALVQVQGLTGTSDMVFPSRSEGYAGTFIPHIAVVGAADLQPLTFRAGSSALAGGLTGIRLVLKRSAGTELFVMVVATIPGLLAVLLGAALFVRKRRFGPEGFFGIAAVLLAVLPIRAVLVPSNLNTLTAVDYLLGFEMALLAAVAVLGLAREIRRSRAGGDGNADSSD